MIGSIVTTLPDAVRERYRYHDCAIIIYARGSADRQEVTVKKINQKESAVTVLRTMLEHLLKDIYAYREHVLEEEENEVLHQFRISVRRSVVLMGEFSFLDRNGQLLEHRKALKTLISISNVKRDLDVLYGQVCSLKEKPAYSNEVLLLLKKDLGDILQEEHRVIMEYLLSQTCTDILRSWEAYLSQDHLNTVSDNGKTTIKKLADKVIYGRFLKIQKQIKTLERKPGSPEEKLHALRISYKKLRYLLETFISLYRKKKIYKLLKEMKKIQNILGDFHDSCQQEILLERLLQDEKNEIVHAFITGVLQPDLKKYQKKEIKEIKKQLKKFLKKEKIYRKVFN